MISRACKISLIVMILVLLAGLASCAPPAGWGTDVTATCLKENQWQVGVVITKHPNRTYAKDEIISAPTLLCRSGESAEMRVGDPDRGDDSIVVKIDTAENPGTKDMTFTVEVRNGGLLRSRTFLKVQPDKNATAASAQAGDSVSK